VTSKDIVEKLKADTGIEIDKRKLVMNDQIKAYGKYEVEVKLYTEVTGKINVLVCEK
jgi:large subunit ribosomal protein L9